MKRKIYLSMCLLSTIMLLITSTLTLLIYYNQFNNQVKTEIKSASKLMEFNLNKTKDKVSYLTEYSKENNESRITLIDKDGTVLYDNTVNKENLENHGERAEFKSAMQNGYSEIKRSSDTLNTRTYYYAIKLENNMVLRLSATTNSVFAVFINVIPAILVLIILMLIFSMIIAKKLTQNIVSKINLVDLNNIDKNNIYEELSPFLKKISDQKIDIQNKLEEIKSQNSKLATISENMNEGLIVLDNHNNILSFNTTAYNIFELKNNAIGTNLLHLIRNIEIIEVIKKAQKGEKGSKTVKINNTFELFYSPIFEGNLVVGVILLFFDINERARAEQMRLEFSANVSHELKTPLTSILGYYQMINNGMAKEDDIKAFAMKIEKEAERLIVLIDDIMKLSKLDEQGELKEKTRVNLLLLSKKVINNLDTQIKDKKIKVEIVGDNSIVMGNETMLEEMIFNLVENAIKYNKDSGSIKINILKNMISIEDTGIGIAKSDQSRIFERFYRADKSRSKKIGGTGLGLSIVKHIAMCHNAKLMVESENDKGTKITVLF